MAISRSAESILSLSEMIADTENHSVILVACCIEKGPTLGLLDNDLSRCSKWRAVSLPFSRTSSVRLAVVHITGTLRWVGTSSQQAEKHKTRLDSTHFNHWEHSFHKGSCSSTCNDTGVCGCGGLLGPLDHRKIPELVPLQPVVDIAYGPFYFPTLRWIKHCLEENLDRAFHTKRDKTGCENSMMREYNRAE